jgi:hypothetical protein
LTVSREGKPGGQKGARALLVVTNVVERCKGDSDSELFVITNVVERCKGDSDSELFVITNVVERCKGDSDSELFVITDVVERCKWDPRESGSRSCAYNFGGLRNERRDGRRCIWEGCVAARDIGPLVPDPRKGAPRSPMNVKVIYS